MNFKELKELNLNKNKISDIKVLERIKFEKLEKIVLNDNKIDKVKFDLLLNSLKSKIKITL